MSTVIIASVIFAAVMLIITKVPVAWAMNQMGGYDNRLPRVQEAKLQGFGKRAMSAHENSIEAFPLFAVGVLLALWAEAAVASIEIFCWVFVLARIAYVICYWCNWHLLRSMVWSAGFLASIGLMSLALP